jgi:glycosyltransferase involved in cell wall biosynthesis
MKVSLITVVYNAEKYITDCIESVLKQTYTDIQYIVIDGASTDTTISLIEKYQDQIHYFISEKDEGIYHAINKGIAVATGQIIGILNADDMLASPNVISEVVSVFENRQIEAVYGNLNYVDRQNTNRVIRKWISKPYLKKDILLGWMPAHPTLYVKAELYQKYGNYSLTHGTAADYELILRLFYKFQINAVFIDKLMVNMRTGGLSNNSLKQRYLAMLNDYKALKSNKISFPLITLILKKITKIPQFLT